MLSLPTTDSFVLLLGGDGGRWREEGGAARSETVQSKTSRQNDFPVHVHRPMD